MGKLAKLMCAFLIISLLAVPMVGCAKPLTLRILAPMDGETVDESPVEVRGSVSDPKATVWVNDTIVAVSKKGIYITTLELAEGENTIKVTAARGKPGKWKDVIKRTVTVTYSVEKPLAIELSSPEDKAELTESPVTVSGKVSDPAAKVTVNGAEVDVASDGVFSIEPKLVEGENTIEIIATVEGKELVTQTITVTYKPSQ